MVRQAVLERAASLCKFVGAAPSPKGGRSARRIARERSSGARSVLTDGLARRARRARAC